MSLGTHHQPSDTGYTKEIRQPVDDPNISGGGIPIINGVGKGAGPFHQPTDVSIAENGDIFISDGYRNSRAHKFSPDGTLLKSWGEPGNAQDLKGTKDKPGFFHTPHGIWAHKDRSTSPTARTTASRSTTLDGEFIEIWTGFERPTKIYMDKKRSCTSRSSTTASASSTWTALHRQLRQRAQQRPGQVLGPALHLGRLRGQHLRSRGARRLPSAEVRAGEVGTVVTRTGNKYRSSSAGYLAVLFLLLVSEGDDG